MNISMTNDRGMRPGSVEWEFLVVTARLNMDDASEFKLRYIINRGLDWDFVISEGFRHGTIGLIYKHLKGLDGVDIPTDVKERLRNSYLRVTAAGALHLAQLERIMKGVQGAGCELIVLKGMTLAEMIYGDLGLRPLSDVDVLVKEQEWPIISSMLSRHGYRSSKLGLTALPPKITKYDVQAHIQILSPAETCLEVQFDLLTLGIGMRDIEGIWRRARNAVIGSAEILVLSPEDQLLHLVVHANRHGCTRLKWLVDIVEIVSHGPAIDWEVLAEIAKRENVNALFYPIIEHTARLLDAPEIMDNVPSSMLPRAYQRALWKKVWPQKKLDSFEGRVEDAVCYYYYRPFCIWNLLNFALTGRIRDKMAYQVRWICPSLSWMAEYYREKKSFKLLRYYPLRFINRLGKGANKY